MKRISLLLFLIVLVSCSQQQQARKPISESSGTFIQESIERNKKLNKEEETRIAQFIKNDSLNKYLVSPKGYWYSYDTKVDEATKTPERGEIAYFDYEIRNLNKELIYSQKELKSKVYYVDKEDVLLGLRDGIKTMKKGEKVTFLFPSHKAYGYHGDDNKIGTNEPLLCTVTLNDIKTDNSKKENENN
ncbi:gliding motility-associated peptidyl-prolyl isomerase GldI [Flavobacterium sp.]|uniref:gliding motility-associated peptidyl-prolyl isomerase GldI n=1 Tax=Flavobacterium sp. TaxID=239 RepID=UPI003F69A4C9